MLSKVVVVNDGEVRACIRELRVTFVRHHRSKAKSLFHRATKQSLPSDRVSLKLFPKNKNIPPLLVPLFPETVGQAAEPSIDRLFSWSLTPIILPHQLYKLTQCLLTILSHNLWSLSHFYHPYYVSLPAFLWPSSFCLCSCQIIVKYHHLPKRFTVFSFVSSYLCSHECDKCIFPRPVSDPQQCCVKNIRGLCFCGVL